MGEKNFNRRPLKSRQTKWANFLSQWLSLKGFRPNQISIASILFAMLAGLFFLQVRILSGIFIKIISYILAAVCIQLRLVCNLLDGMVAIEKGLKTKTGDIFNDFPDRLADLIIFVCAGFSITKIPYASHLGWLAAVMAIMTAYVRLLGGSLGVRQSFCGPMAKQHRMATLTISCILSSIGVFLGLEDHIMAMGLLLIIIGSIITIVRRILRIVGELQRR